jgi:hypothetical protein
MIKADLEIKIGVKITDREFDYLKQYAYENESAIMILRRLADKRYLLLQEMEQTIHVTFKMLKIIKNLYL